MCRLWLQSVCALILVAWLARLAVSQEDSREGLLFFEQKIRPMLVTHCFECHSTTTETNGGLVLDSKEGIIQGGDHGAAVDLKNLEASLILTAIHYSDPEFEMPPKGKLSERDIALFEQWVKMGLPYPAVDVKRTEKPKIDIEAGKQHWAFRDFSDQPISLPTDSSHPSALAWAARRHDAFILAQQQANGMQPNAAADKRTLYRRAKFDLLGLPATFEEIEAFANNPQPDAFEQQIEAWLAMPQYGERWSRAWLELVRYCDVPEQWAEIHHTYRYRDWVLNAFNEDMPYDRLVRLQIAADQIEDARDEDLAALGFIGLSPTYWKELQLPVEIIKSIVSDEYEERIYSWSSTFLGVNVSCARCHDHKTEPFTQQDYYAIAGVFANSRLVDRVLDRRIDSLQVIDAKKQVGELETKLTKLNGEIVAAEKKEKEVTLNETEKSELEKKRTERDQITEQIAKLKSIPGYDLPMAPGTIDATLEVKPVEQGHGSRIVYVDQPKEAAIEIRGNPNKLGEVIPRRYLTVLSDQQPVRFSNGSGRLDLANAMLEQSGPLMARVIVNRIWKLHFGRGIVETPSDFGTQGERPSHPELLEDLARSFVENGWSLKWLHKEIMLSSAYQQSSRTSDTRDPGNQYFARFPLRRLEVEAWRDTMLAVTGRLDSRVGGEPFDLNQTENGRRTLYGIVVRRELADMLRLYDFPDPVTHSPQRLPTSTALQQLFVLNSPFMLSQARGLFEHVQRLETQDKDFSDSTHMVDSTQRRIRLVYRLLYGRFPNDKELELGRQFVGDGSPEAWQLYCQTLLGSNEFWFVD
jgi:cytochrome c553